MFSETSRDEFLRGVSLSLHQKQGLENPDSAVVIKLMGTIDHGPDCRCPKCNANGESWEAGAFLLSEFLDAAITGDGVEPIYAAYGPSEESAIEFLRDAAEKRGHVAFEINGSETLAVMIERYQAEQATNYPRPE